MTLDDPYFVAKEEMCRALDNARSLYSCVQEMESQAAVNGASGRLELVAEQPTLDAQQEIEWTRTELRNALRSIDWDLEDVDETIRIVEKTPNKYKIDNRELSSRRQFLEQTRQEIKIMKDKMNMNFERDYDRTIGQPMGDSPVKTPSPLASAHGSARYCKLESETDSPNRLFIRGIANPNAIMPPTEDQLETMSNDTTSSSKAPSRQMNTEFDERQFFLDDFANEMEIITNETKFDSTVKKMAKVFHLSNGNYNEYSPAPSTVIPNVNYAPTKSFSLCSLTTSIRNCFLCTKD